MNPWAKGLIAGVISGVAQGVLTGLAANGIAPGSFSVVAHTGNVMMLAGASAMFGAIIGGACYLKQSPLP